MKSLIVLLLLTAAAAQEIVARTGETFHPVTVEFTYSLPATDPTVAPLLKAAETDPAMAPAKIIWFWGDEVARAPKRNFTEYRWSEGQKISHTYTKPGSYGVSVIIVDRKNRSIRQTGFSFKLNEMLEVQRQ